MLMDFPANTKRLSTRERELAIRRLQRSDSAHTTEDERLGHLQALKKSLSDWRTWLFVVGYIAIVGSSTLSYFYPTLVEGLGFSTTISQYMTIPVSCPFQNLIRRQRGTIAVWCLYDPLAERAVLTGFRPSPSGQYTHIMISLLTI